MTLIVEDGTGVAGAESYASVTDADSYWSARGNTVWAGLTQTQKDQALRSACAYMEAIYMGKWKGRRVSSLQPLSFPRSGIVVDDVQYVNTVPSAIRDANIELALRSSDSALMEDQGAQVASETVGPISVTYAQGARQGTRYAYVEALLQPFLIGMNQIKVVRA